MAGNWMAKPDSGGATATSSHEEIVKAETAGKLDAKSEGAEEEQTSQVPKNTNHESWVLNGQRSSEATQQRLQVAVENIVPNEVLRDMDIAKGEALGLNQRTHGSAKMTAKMLSPRVEAHEGTSGSDMPMVAVPVEVWKDADMGAQEIVQKHAISSAQELVVEPTSTVEEAEPAVLSDDSEELRSVLRQRQAALQRIRVDCAVREARSEEFREELAASEARLRGEPLSRELEAARAKLQRIRLLRQRQATLRTKTSPAASDSSKLPATSSKKPGGRRHLPAGDQAELTTDQASCSGVDAEFEALLQRSLASRRRAAALRADSMRVLDFIMRANIEVMGGPSMHLRPEDILPADTMVELNLSKQSGALAAKLLAKYRICMAACHQQAHSSASPGPRHLPAADAASTGSSGGCGDLGSVETDKVSSETGTQPETYSARESSLVGLIATAVSDAIFGPGGFRDSTSSSPTLPASTPDQTPISANLPATFNSGSPSSSIVGAGYNELRRKSRRESEMGWDLDAATAMKLWKGGHDVDANGDHSLRGWGFQNEVLVKHDKGDYIRTLKPAMAKPAPKKATRPSSKCKQRYIRVRALGHTQEAAQVSNFFTRAYEMITAAVNNDALGVLSSQTAMNAASFNHAEWIEGLWSRWAMNYTHLGLQLALSTQEPDLLGQSRQALVLTCERLLLFKASYWSVAQELELQDIEEVRVSPLSETIVHLRIRDQPDVLLDLTDRATFLEELHRHAESLANLGLGFHDTGGLPVTVEPKPLFTAVDAERNPMRTIAYLAQNELLLLDYAPNSLLLSSPETRFYGFLDLRHCGSSVDDPSSEWAVFFFVLKGSGSQGRRLHWCVHPCDCVGESFAVESAAAEAAETEEGDHCIRLWRPSLLLRAKSKHIRDRWLGALRSQAS